MYEQFCSRYEDGLKLIVKGVTTKGGVKKYDRVNQRIGRLAQKYLYYVRSTKYEYNCIREIESTFRTLKTDLDLRPIYHKTDDASQAHLHLGLMAYWVVNTIRYQLKELGVTSDWRELLRVMNTQKCVTTTMTNDKGQHLSVRCCSKPETKVAQIYRVLRTQYKYDKLKLKHAPFTRRKSVVLKIEPEATEKVVPLKDTG